MPVVPSDIEHRLSVPSASSGDSAPQPQPFQSLGRWMSTTPVAEGLHGLFDPVTGADNEREAVDHRCIFITNTNATSTLHDVAVWIASEVAGGADVRIGLDPAGVVAADATTPQAQTIVQEETAPSGVTFSAPSTRETGLAIGTLGPGECVAVWVERTATDSPPVDADGVTLRVDGDTSE